MRMSSGPSLRNEKPRSAWSSCIDDTPMSSTTPSTRVEALRAARSRRDRRSGPAPASGGSWTWRPARRRRRSHRDRGRWRRRCCCGCGIEDGARVAAGAERAVDEGAAALRIERVADLRQEHGNVTGRSASGSGSWAVAASRHRSRAPGEVSCTVRGSTIRVPNAFFRSRTFVRASSRCARKRSGSQIWNL